MMYLFDAVTGIQANHCFGSRGLRAVSSDWQETTQKPGLPATATMVFVVSRSSRITQKRGGHFGHLYTILQVI
jgi:hypothetical protein